MDKVTQREGGGGSPTDLGSFDRLSQSDDKATVTLHYTKGAHCWGLNEPRKADMRVHCGKEHKLLSSTETSTCFYELEFESPIGCTPEFAAANGISLS